LENDKVELDLQVLTLGQEKTQLGFWGMARPGSFCVLGLLSKRRLVWRMRSLGLLSSV
jgi:hypothetical protein